MPKHDSDSIIKRLNDWVIKNKNEYNFYVEKGLPDDFIALSYKETCPKSPSCYHNLYFKGTIFLQIEDQKCKCEILNVTFEFDLNTKDNYSNNYNIDTALQDLTLQQEDLKPIQWLVNEHAWWTPQPIGKIDIVKSYEKIKLEGVKKFSTGKDKKSNNINSEYLKHLKTYEYANQIEDNYYNSINTIKNSIQNIFSK